MLFITISQKCWRKNRYHLYEVYEVNAPIILNPLCMKYCPWNIMTNRRRVPSLGKVITRYDFFKQLSPLKTKTSIEFYHPFLSLFRGLLALSFAVWKPMFDRIELLENTGVQKIFFSRIELKTSILINLGSLKTIVQKNLSIITADWNISRRRYRRFSETWKIKESLGRCLLS